MTWRPAPNSSGDPQELYFFLSYAHSVPVALPNQSDSDYWVRRMFEDLGRAVSARAGGDGSGAVGEAGPISETYPPIATDLFK